MAPPYLPYLRAICTFPPDISHFGILPWWAESFPTCFPTCGVQFGRENVEEKTLLENYVGPILAGFSNRLAECESTLGGLRWQEFARGAELTYRFFSEKSSLFFGHP